jgi:hypothetical protein
MATMDGDYDSGLDGDDPGMPYPHENFHLSNLNAGNTYDSFSDTEDECLDIARCTDRDCPYFGYWGPEGSFSMGKPFAVCAGAGLPMLNHPSGPK